MAHEHKGAGTIRLIIKKVHNRFATGSLWTWSAM